MRPTRPDFHPIRVFAAVLLALFLLPSARAFASSGDELATDAAALTQFEERALHADTREQCFLYTQLARAYSEIASKQIAAGEMEKASQTLRQIEHATALAHGSLSGNAKRLKDAQLTLHAASFRLAEVLRYVSNEDKVMLQATLKNLNKVNAEILAQVFAH